MIMKYRQLIGLTGPAGCGKTTLAHQLCTTFGYTRYSVATPMKQALAALGVPKTYLQDHTLKQKYLPQFNSTARRMLQTLGTEWGRKQFGKDFWINVLATKIEDELPNCVVIDDIRYDNEAMWVHGERGLVIEVKRPSLDSGVSTYREHKSEKGVSAHLIDFNFHNDLDTIESLGKQVTQFMEDIGGYESGRH